MPYEGEFAAYLPLQRIADSDQVKALLKRAKRALSESEGGKLPRPQVLPVADSPLPDLVLAIDGSNAEVNVANGYPGARVGYITVASVLLNLKLVDALDEYRPVDPVKFRTTEEAATRPAALPGSNVVTREHISARDSFRAELYDLIHNAVVDDDDHARLIETYEELLRYKPREKQQRCPYSYDGCEIRLSVPAGLTECPCSKRRAIFSTDALRIHEGFRDDSSNGQALGETMQVWEQLLLVHLLRCLEIRGMLEQAQKIAFFIDGPLAVFGHPAWLSAAISTELKRLNAEARKLTGRDLTIIGIEKSGTFVDHFSDIDIVHGRDEPLFEDRSFFMPNDDYIKQRIIYSASEKRYGADTYFGRKFFYKTKNGSRIVANIPFLDDEQDSLLSSELSLYPQIPVICGLLDKLVSSRFENAVTPIVSAHAHAAIPLHLGEKVLKQLAAALMKDGK
ncbi:NurA domain-containing protein [Micromonospora palomenae]|uniref:NurA domain-containing protein n=1 Tax=Micromonospora palomenae TaxID=1461247 RepID=A0A561WCE2_9ACTN|nr:DNA double-strand break repair nuclease NurA [Micromonospora palomenae]TWG21528.1 NurA domain-containing protein [Micromonospora palomenae]